MLIKPSVQPGAAQPGPFYFVTRDPAGYVPANLIAYRDSKDFRVDLSEP